MAGPNSQNQYSPHVVPFDGGLDYITPRIASAPGTLNACLNFERTDREGYSRSFGYERFDGGMLPSLAYTNLVYLVHPVTASTAVAREEIWIDDNPGVVLGCVVELTSSTRTLIAITNFDQWRLVLQAINAGTTIDITTSLSSDTFTVSNILTFDAGYTGVDLDAQDYTLARNDLFQAMNAIVESPGNPAKPVIGLHGFKDQLYAVKDLNIIRFNSGGTVQMYSNDIIRPAGGTSDDDIRILDIQLDSGTWAGGDAAGYFQVDTGGDTIALTNYDLIRPTSTSTNNVTIIAGTLSAGSAGLYRSNDYDQAVENGTDVGWSSVDLGYYMNFVNGTQYGPPRIYRRGSFSVYTTDTFDSADVASTAATTDSLDGSMTPIPGDSWTYTGSTLIDSCIHDEQTSKYVRRTINNSVSTVNTTPGNLNVDDFVAIAGFSATSGLNVQGVEVKIRTRAAPLTAQFCPMQLSVQPRSAGALAANTTSQTIDIQQQYTPGGFPASLIQYLTFGGPTDLWGLDAAGMKAILNSTFGMQVQPWAAYTNTVRQGVIDIFYIEVKVYFTQDITDYYFWDGVDDVTAAVTNVYVTNGPPLGTGDWSTNDAEGILQVTNIVPYLTANRRSIKNGDEIRTSPGGAGLLVATIDSEMAYNGLDTLAAIEAAKSRYEFITANFYAEEDFEAMYGVSGAGRAFSYDGFYFDRIFTQTDDAKDKPRHLAENQFHLVLGYASGSNLLSVTGNPQDFNGVAGATEIACGDPVVGYARMSGTTLGIFCKKTIQGLVGTSIDNFSLTVLAPYEGAIEYTVADVGKPIFTSYRGISLFDQTAAYGDFNGTRLSYSVTPFLVPRLQGIVSPLGSVAVSSGPVVAIVCRSKNQYQLTFGDGYRLTMTLAGPDQQPMFTIQAPALYDNTGGFKGYIVPRAESSYIDSKGAERIHVAPYSPAITMSAYHVYEFERSWTFDGWGIPAYVVTNENFYGNTFDIDNVRKVRLHGLSLGYAPLRVRVGKNYDNNDTVIQVPREAVNCSLPREPADFLTLDYNPITCKADIAKSGRSFTYRFMSYDITTQDEDVTDPVYADVCPPFVIQAALFQFTEDKGDV